MYIREGFLEEVMSELLSLSERHVQAGREKSMLKEGWWQREGLQFANLNGSRLLKPLKP